ncbi:zinc finger protein 292a [Synchiropus splendidus]|uniref:zinc finger protein 292a n=1 Tax=Synchiropus splendidus TaxID=270530 RepID=UPI00237E90D2|nr:zinc finger protein 292a [Synchiropus splendidus]
MAEGETEKEYDTRRANDELRERFQALSTTLKESSQPPLEASLRFCQDFCQVLVEHAGRWKTDEDPLPLLEVYTAAILSFAHASSCLSSECENVPLLLEKLALSCAELVLLLPQQVPGALWEEFQSSIKSAQSLLQESGSMKLCLLSVLAQQNGAWSNPTLCDILSNSDPQPEKVHEYLEMEGPTLLKMRIKHLIKMDSPDKAALLAKTCSDYAGYEGKGTFKATFLLCICMSKSQEELMDEISSIDCKDALEMICNLESDGDEKGALCLCSAFLKRQLLQGEVYCAWELTLFWSKLLMRIETPADSFLKHCKEMALLCRSVCHILFLIKVIQNEIGEVGLPVCVEMCIQALKMTSSDHKDSKSTICKTIYCLLPTDLEVKRACQLTEFLLQPTVDSYYAVESLFNEPDQKPEENASLPVPNSLRCELLLALKTQWPFDPEFWDWKTLKCNCLALMGEEAAIVSSIDTLNDTDEQEMENLLGKVPEYRDLEDFLLTTTNELNEITDEKEKNREVKKLREQGFVSARFRNWRAYMQYCVLCDKEFLGHRIVRHAQKHFKDGVYLCPICADSFESREVLEPHVASHVKQSCKERLAAMKAAGKVPKPPLSPKSPSKNINVVRAKVSPVKTESQMGQPETTVPVKTEPATSDTTLSHDCFCPVKNCSKAFKFFRNLMAHVRSHKNDEEAMRFLEIQKQKVICQYCRRQFVNVRHLNDHLQMHCGSKPYICIQLDCKANFNSNSELLMHRKTHSEFKAQCMFPNCGQVFSEAYLLYDHEAQHYLTFTCQFNNCGRIFFTHPDLLSHQATHGANGSMNTVSMPNQNTSVAPQGEPVQVVCTEDTHSASVGFDPVYTNASVEASTASQYRAGEGTAALEVRGEHSMTNSLKSMGDLNCKDPENTAVQQSNPCLAEAEVASEGHQMEATTEAALVQVEPNVSQAKQTLLVPKLEVVPEAQVGPEGRHIDYRVADQCVITVGPPPNAVNPMANEVGERHNGFPRTYCQETVPQIMTPAQIKTEVHPSLQGYPASGPIVQESDENLHCCPNNECTRAYSTNKSLSRHVKKQHPEIFEDWKLAKKYNKVAKMSNKKMPGGPALPSQPESPANMLPKHTGQICNKPAIEQMTYPSGCSASPGPNYPGPMDPVPITPMVNPTLYPSWGGQHNPGALMQPEMSQSWSSAPMSNCYPSGYNMNEYPPRNYSQWPADPYHTSAALPQPERDLSMAPLHGPHGSHTPSDSSLMSQYLSSSLMLDNGAQMHNGGHSYGHMLSPLSQEGSRDSVEVRKTSASVTEEMNSDSCVSTTPGLPEGSYNTQYAQSENTQSSAVEPPMKCPEAQDGTKLATELIKTESVASPAYEQMDNAVEGTMSPHGIVPPDYHFEGECTNSECKASPADEKCDDSDFQKEKTSKLTKRAKWPAIIKEGKVICRRCFREFTSTKSLGGHLSKRSQCRPLDEIDLTADLPTSFLDFLNDPHVPDTNGVMYNASNGDFPQDSNSLTTLSSPMALKQEPQHCSIMPFPNFANTPVNQRPRNMTHPGHDSSMEMSHSFDRMGPVEATGQKIPNNLPLDQSCDTPKTVKSKAMSKGSKLSEKVPKPFKCDQDSCEYSFMTKEALFKHLRKMHDFTDEMIEELKRTPSKLAPYPCQICPKTFTRTTGLRIHYEKVHRLDKAEMQRLRISARHRRAFRLNKEETNNNHAADAKPASGTLSSPTLHTIKQEPPDTTYVQQVDNENNPTHMTTETVNDVALHAVPIVATAHTHQAQATDIPCGVPVPPDVASQIHRSPEVKERAIVKEKRSPGTPKKLKGGLDTPMSKPKEQGPHTPNASASISPEGPSSSKSSPSKDEFQKKEKVQKRLKMCDMDNPYSPYRPYRCVHEGCTAAFTIQQNLILHYRAMHQASLPLCKTDSDPEHKEGTHEQEGVQCIEKDDEVRCQVKNCSRVFMGITRLVQHYLLLHKFTRDKATTMMSSMMIGTFNCDRPECTLSFTSVDSYIEHIKNYHMEIAISESGSVDQTFRCQYEGCERIYSTKSNLLRHLIKKHNYVYDPKASDGRRNKSAGLFPAVTNGKENVESKLKLKKKTIKKKDCKSIEHWTNFGKPALKSHEDASVICTKKTVLQYPCMIVGCDTVEPTERNIFKHYTTHGLTERCIEDQRSQFIFCKKYSRARCKDVSKSEGVSPEKVDSEQMMNSEEQQDAEETLNKSGQETNESNESQTEGSVLSQTSTLDGGPRRGRPKKPVQPTPACPRRLKTLRNRLTVNSGEDSNPDIPSPPEQQQTEVAPASSDPPELEDSPLESFETSEPTQSTKRKLDDKSSVDSPSKKPQMQKCAAKAGGRIKKKDELEDFQNHVDFRNPLNLTSGSNVKIVMDKKLSEGADQLLKQLQDMKPKVVIKRCLLSGS